jgi:hypothetical protein
MFRKLSTALFAVLLVMAIAAVSYADRGTANSVNPKILGSTYGEWAAEWWIWATAGPDGENVIQDMTGEFCGANQPNGKVWFLAGTFGEAGIERDCTIPEGKALFYPLLNSVWIDCPPPSDDGDLTDTEVRAIMAEFGGGGNNACRLTSTIDGADVFGGFLTSNAISTLQILDVRTQSAVFSIPLPENHVFGGLCAPALPSGETGRSIAEGHWVMVPPLSPGEHELTLHGADCGDDPFEVGVTYHLTVLDDDDDDD